MSENSQSHWVDTIATKILKQHSDKDSICCASGITPSGTVHIGNFREIITTELIVRSLRELTDKNIRFIYSWDDYDVFRKVPQNMPNQDMLRSYLRKPIVDIPDPTESGYKSYAQLHEKRIEECMPKLGIFPEYLYQSEKYRAKEYAEGMKKALEKRLVIKEILDKWRKEPLPESYVPIRIFCEKCNKDTVEDIVYEGDYKVTYTCECGHSDTFDLREKGIAKLSWRIDWPMRWSVEKVLFEPGGKDHSSPGGSYETGKEIAQKVYNFNAPMYIMYDFIRIKGAGGKISSSTGNVITIDTVLDIYEPEMVRWLFASTRPGSEFAISFDGDVIKLYEDFDKCERVYYHPEIAKNEKEAGQQKRIYELSQIQPVKPQDQKEQIGFRHITTILQIFELDVEKTYEFLKKSHTNIEEKRIKVRIQCAKNWILHYAPDEFKFIVSDETKHVIEEHVAPAFEYLIQKLQTESDPEKIGLEVYHFCKEKGIAPKDFFTHAYKALISRDKGPKLIPFIQAIGVERAVLIFQKALKNP
ncbi:MAG: lysine--tRNA ligase [Candidatus Woesearchaeota archaeon]